MPLSKERQRQWMREYRERKKGIIPDVISKIPRLVMEGNKIVGVHPDLSRAKLRERSRGVNKNDSEKELPPICTTENFRQFKVGEVVRVWQGKRMVEVEIPELDGDGNPM